jgi:uncharacterized protein with GYD domain
MLFCITAHYTPNALNAMRENPKTDRRQAVEELVKAAGGKLVGFYGTLSDGPGVLTIIDVEPEAAAAITGTVVSSGAVQNVKMTRLWTSDEMNSIRQKRVQLHTSYKAPGQ